MTAQAILYIHGFNSSPLSEKATMTEHYLAEAKPQCHWRVPRLPCLPDEAIAYLREYIESWSNELAISPNEIALIGSSLGGYYAAHLATMYQQKAWLVNPAMHPYRLLVDYLGVQTNPYTGEVFELTAEHMQALQAIEVSDGQLRPERFTILLESADETLDYREAVRRFHRSRLWVQFGGNHRCISYESWLPAAVRWLTE